jgi:hypothetical protein
MPVGIAIQQLRDQSGVEFAHFLPELEETVGQA